MPLMIDTLELFEEAPRRAAMREGAMVGGSGSGVLLCLSVDTYLRFLKECFIFGESLNIVGNFGHLVTDV